MNPPVSSMYMQPSVSMYTEFSIRPEQPHDFGQASNKMPKASLQSTGNSMIVTLKIKGSVAVIKKIQEIHVIIVFNREGNKLIGIYGTDRKNKEHRPANSVSFYMPTRKSHLSILAHSLTTSTAGTPR